MLLFFVLVLIFVAVVTGRQPLSFSLYHPHLLSSYSFILSSPFCCYHGVVLVVVLFCVVVVVSAAVVVTGVQMSLVSCSAVVAFFVLVLAFALVATGTKLSSSSS